MFTPKLYKALQPIGSAVLQNSPEATGSRPATCGLPRPDRMPVFHAALQRVWFGGRIDLCCVYPRRETVVAGPGSKPLSAQQRASEGLA